MRRQSLPPQSAVLRCNCRWPSPSYSRVVVRCRAMGWDASRQYHYMSGSFHPQPVPSLRQPANGESGCPPSSAFAWSASYTTESHCIRGVTDVTLAHATQDIQFDLIMASSQCRTKCARVGLCRHLSSSCCLGYAPSQMGSPCARSTHTVT